MATPIGHALAGWAVARAAPGRPPVRGLALACAALAVAPDLDFLPGLLQGRPALYHQGATHSLAAAAGAAVLAMAVLRPAPGQRAAVGALAFLAYASHLLLDLFGPDARPPLGIPLLWPFSDATWLAPVTLLPGVHHAAHTDVGTGAWLTAVASPRNVLAVGREVLAVAPLVVGAEIVRRARGRRGAPRSAPASRRDHAERAAIGGSPGATDAPAGGGRG